MPWCEPCNRYFNPNTLLPDGRCPSCGSQAGQSGAKPTRPPAAAAAQAESQPQKAPWHFKLLVAATVIYVGWRIVEIIGRVVS